MRAPLALLDGGGKGLPKGLSSRRRHVQFEVRLRRPRIEQHKEAMALKTTPRLKHPRTNHARKSADATNMHAQGSIQTKRNEPCRVKR